MRPFLIACALLAAAPPLAGQGVVLDPAGVSAQTDTFSFRVNGRDVGRQVTTLRPEAAGFLFRETTTTPAGHQTTEVRLDEALHMLSVHQEGELAGETMRIDVDYAAGRARGEARVPGPTGISDITVDATVPVEVVDDNVLMALLPALPWAPDAAFELPVFSAGTNSVTVYAFRVAGTEPITVPAGTFEAFRVDVTGGAQPLLVHVSAVEPHRLLRLEVVGAPMELVLTGTGRP